MEKSFVVIALFVSALCFSFALARKTPAHESFYVQGKIYCDPCGFEIETRLSTPLAGVNITLQCVKEDNDIVTYTKEGVSDKNGMYNIPVHGDHEEDICVVVANTPTKGQCKEAMSNKSDRIVLSKNMGVSSLTRYVNPLGFMTKTIDSQCDLVADELALDDLYG